MAKRLQNITIAEFQSFLRHHGLSYIRTTNGLEVWTRADLTRPVVFQSHIDPIPIFIVKNNLRTIGLTTQDLRDFFS